MSETVPAEQGRRRTTIAIWAALIGAGAIPIAALGRVAGLWPSMPTMLVAFPVCVIALLTGLILGLIGVLSRKGRPWSAYQVRGAAFALVVSLIVLIPVGSFVPKGLNYPPIHEATTDTDNPPQYVALLKERADTNAPNSVEFNPKIAPQIKAGFPDLKPLELPVPADEAFKRAVKAAEAMGWRVAAAEPAEGRIEAVAVTFWSGFVDDVVIRVTPVGESQSRIDARSVSRLGGGDAGANGLRLLEFLARPELKG
jgi:uncharacterized protein (DUF1499 family)